MKTLLAAAALALAWLCPRPPPRPARRRSIPCSKASSNAGSAPATRFSTTSTHARGAGDSAPDFHAAADGRGPSFTLLRVSDPAGQAWLVGGYNPQSWDSDDGWHFTQRDFQRTAFVFNYTAPAVYRQVPSSFELPSQGSFQTFNAIDQGPTFGAGPDLFVDESLDTALSWRLSYGDPAGEGRSIIDGSVGGRFFAIDAMEVYAVSPIPEPAGAGMLAGGLGLVALAMARRKRG